MAIQPRLPLAALGSTIDSIEERARALEARRIFYGGSLGTTVASGIVPTTLTWVNPAGMPTVTITAGITGLVFVFVSAYTDNTSCDLQMGVSINGGAVQLVGDASQLAAFGGLLLTGAAGFTVTPNADSTFASYARLTGSNTAVNEPAIAVIPI